MNEDAVVKTLEHLGAQYLVKKKIELDLAYELIPYTKTGNKRIKQKLDYEHFIMERAVREFINYIEGQLKGDDQNA